MYTYIYTQSRFNFQVVYNIIIYNRNHATNKFVCILCIKYILTRVGKFGWLKGFFVD